MDILLIAVNYLYLSGDFTAAMGIGFQFGLKIITILDTRTILVL
jgi:hypothetical protein